MKTAEQSVHAVATSHTVAPRVRIAIVVSHPIQHFAPWHRELAAIPGVEVKVFFCLRRGAHAYFDRDFGREVKWDTPLLEGYEFEFLETSRPDPEMRFLRVDNPGVGDALAKFRPDAVQLFGYFHRTMWRALRWCMRNRVPVLLYSDSNASAPRPFWKRALKRLLLRPFYGQVSGALFTGDNNRKYHRQFGVAEERLYQGALPIDKRMLLNSTGDPVEARRHIREKYGIPSGAFVAIFCGKLYPGKSPLHFVEAIARCNRDGVPVWGLIVGDGVQRAEIERTIADQALTTVVVAGFVNQGSIGKYYASADLLVSTSALDAHPLVIPEAGCFGLPVVISDRVGCIGNSDTARSGSNALIYRWGDIEELASSIVELVRDKNLYCRMSASAREIADSQDVTVAAVQLRDAAVQLVRFAKEQRA